MMQTTETATLAPLWVNRHAQATCHFSMLHFAAFPGPFYCTIRIASA